MPIALALDHLVLVVADVERSLAWYQRHAGLDSLNVDEWRAGNALFPSLRITADTIIDFVPGEIGDGRGHVDHLCFVVAPEGLEEIRAEQELEILDEGPRSGARGIGDSIYVRDPDGLLVEFRCYQD